MPRAPKRSADLAKDLSLGSFRQAPTDGGLPLAQAGARLADKQSRASDPYQGKVARDSADHACELSPRSIFEAMLFVGGSQSVGLSSAQVAELMQGVRPAEIDALASEIDRDYQRRNCPYRIHSGVDGYRLVLRDEYARLRDRFYDKSRRARLSTAAIEVLSLVAYRAPISGDEITRLRGKASGAILMQLVRRRLLRGEWSASRPRRLLYSTTERFLHLFGLKSLNELPQGDELDER